MTRPLSPALLAIAFSASMIAAATVHAESHVSCNTLPAAVLQHAKLEAGDATIRGCVKDKENGKLIYEVETLKDGKSMDIVLDASGTVLEVEQEVAASNVPAAVSDAIAKAANGGKVGKIESVSRNGAIASYETTIASQGRRREVAFSPEGAPVKAD
jgi:threonine dehydrogenase-like Zn-dependent dehydrogenase